MSLASVSRMEAKLLLPTYERQPILFERGRGVYLWDSQRKRYLDFLSESESTRSATATLSSKGRLSVRPEG